MTDVLGP
jgi:hypothetical protein